MRKSLFRFVDRFELLSCYLLCFIFNIVFDFVKTLSIDSHLLQTFLKQFYDYQALITFLFTFIVVIFHYQMLHKKKVEVYCRILVGDTILSITIRYILECVVILGITFIISIIINIFLNINLTNNIYLACIFVFYILISAGKVWRFENF